MLTNDKRIRVITGHYGSGKSEFALNYVLKLREQVEGKVALSDLDVVNVYFRTREKKDMLEAKGIKVISSSVNTPSVDIPALSGEITVPMTHDDYDYVIDLGGDKVGATVIGSFRHMMKDDDYDMFFILNANRERTQTAQEAAEFIDEIESVSRLKVTGIVNNTHMLKSTTVEDVLHGQEVAKELSELKNIPIRYVSCLESLVDKLPDDLEGEVIPINLQLREDWML